MRVQVLPGDGFVFRSIGQKAEGPIAVAQRLTSKISKIAGRISLKLSRIILIFFLFPSGGDIGAKIDYLYFKV